MIEWNRARRLGITRAWRKRIAVLLATAVMATSLQLTAFAQPADEGLDPELQALMEQLFGEEGQPGMEGGPPQEEPTVTEEVYDPEAVEAALLAGGGLERISVSADGSAPTGDSRASSLSGDGRYVAFVSASANITAGDTNGFQDVFVRDREAGVTKRISLGAGGVQANGHSYAPMISMDGAYVLFSSKATNLIAGDTNQQEDLFLYRESTGLVERIAERVPGSEYGGHGSPYQISADGRFAAYVGVRSPQTASYDILLKDLTTGKVKLVAAQTYLYDNWRARVSMSADARYLVFESFQRELTLDDYGPYHQNYRDVFLYDTALDELKRINRSPAGVSANQYSQYPIISANGRFIAYQSLASNLGPSDSNGVLDIYVYDRESGTTELGSVRSDGTQGQGDAYDASLSGDGRYLSFHTSNAYDESDTGNLPDVYVRDRIAGTTTRISTAYNGSSANGESVRATLATDGLSIAFESRASDLLETAETDSFYDIYVAPLEGAGGSAPEWPAEVLPSAAPGAAYVALTWPEVPGAAYYKVLQDGKLAAIISEPRYAAAGLAPGTAHTYRIAAGSADYRWSAWSGEVSAVTLAERETTPPDNGSVTVSAQPGLIEADWTLPDDPDVVGAKLIWRIPGFAARESALYPKHVARATIPNLMNGEYYEVRLAVVDGDGNRSFGVWQSVIIPPGPALVRMDTRAEDGRAAPGDAHIEGVTADGRYTLFLSDAPDLAISDTNGKRDVFLYDRLSGAVQLISRTASGAAGNGESRDASISDDGRYIVFASTSSDLTGDTDTNGQYDVFLYDRDTNGNGTFDEESDVSITRLSTAWEGGQGNSSSFGPAISGDGSKVVFFTGARNLVQQPPPGTTYNVSYDMESRELAPILLPGGVPLDASDVELNADGTVMVFSEYESLLPEDGNGSFDIYLYDAAEETLELVTSSAVLGHSSASGAVVDDSGRYVAFSINRNIRPYSQVYVYDREADGDAKYELISVVRPGAEASMHSTTPDISGDGRFVSFQSNESGLVENYKDQLTNIFISDRVAQQTMLASRPYDPAVTPTDYAGGARMSGDGSWIAYSSNAVNMVRGMERYRPGLYLQMTTVIVSEAVWPSGSSVNVKASGSDYATLEWSPATGAEGYRIFGAGEPIDGDEGILEKTITDLEPDTDYLFTVQAMDARGIWTTNGPSVAFKTPASAGLAELAVTQQRGGAMLEWGDRPSGSNEVTGFRIMRRTADGPAEALATIEDPTVRSYTDTTAEPGRMYVYAVYGIDAGGSETPYTIERSFTLTSFAIEGFYHTMSLYFRKYAAIGEQVNLVMQVRDADAAWAELAYELEDGSLTTVRAELTSQTASDIARGQSAIPAEAVRLTAIRGFAERDGEQAEASSLAAPVQIGGSVTVAITGDVALPYDATLTISSAAQRASQTVTIGEARRLTFVGLPAGEDYTLRLLSTGGVDVLGDAGVPPVSVAWGRMAETDAEPVLPASLSITVLGLHNYAAKDIAVLLSDEEGRPLAAGVTPPHGQLEFGPLRGMIGKTVVVRANSPDTRFVAAEVRVPLSSGINRQTITLSRDVNAALDGKVYQEDGTPLQGAVVTAWMDGIAYKATSGPDGSYSMSLPSGWATVQAMAPDGITVASVIYRAIEVGNQTQDITFNRKLPAVVKVNLYTQSGDGAWVGPYVLDWREQVHFHIRADKPERTRVDFGAMALEAEPGETVRICANGREGNYSEACAETIIDDNRRGTVELRLRDTHVKITGRLTNLQTGNARYDYRLYEITAEGYRRAAFSGSLYEAAFELKMQGDRNYELMIQSMDASHSVVRYFEATSGGRIDLGEVPLEPAGILTGKAGNVVWIGGGKPAAGGTAQVRATYYLTGGGPQLSDAVAVLDVPADTELVPGTVILNGNAVEPVLQDGRYTVPIGTIVNYKIGSLQYELRIADDPVSNLLLLEPSIRFRRGSVTREEAIGRAEADLTPVTLKAPGRTGQRDLSISGSAPPGSRVTLYEGDIAVGVTEASPAGLWSIAAHIPGEGATATWQLRADAEHGSARWSSTVVAVRYDKGLPEPIAFTMRQADGRLMTLDPNGGEGRFPYVFVPGMPMTLTVEFTDPELVDNVAFTFGDQRIPASLQKGIFQAVIPSVSRGAAIGLDYTEKEPAASFDAPPPSPEEIKRQLPPSFRDARADYVYVSPRQNGGTSQSASYRGTLPNPKGGAQLDMNASMVEMTYTPNQADLDRAEQTGVPLYGFQNSVSFENGELRAQLTGYIPVDRFSQGLSAEQAAAELLEAVEASIMVSAASGNKSSGKVSALSAGHAVKVVKVSVGLAMRSTAGENTWKTIDAAYSLFDGMGVSDTLKDLERLMDKIALNCRPDLVPIYMESIMRIRNQMIAVEVFKAGLMVAGAVFGPATFGLGTIGLFLASNMMGKVLDAQVAAAITRLDEDVSEFCSPQKKKPKRPLADPEWIYDPSGYVYEVEEGNRVEGVTATVLRWNEQAGRWDVWNAGPYGQMNPLLTDREGRYAWDVPEGKWKVLYEKEGYLPAESEELIVLPPHFDVNIPMTSTLPAKPVKASALPGGAAIELLFDRHVRSEGAEEGLLAVESADTGEAVEGEWRLVEPVSVNGTEASKRLRFIPNDSLAIGGVYRVKAEAALQSYAGVPMGSDYEAEVIVTDTDTEPPLPVEALHADSDAERTLLTWQLPDDPELAKLELRYHAEGAQGEGSTVEVPLDQQYALVEGLNGSTNYVFQVRAYDEAGNYSTAEVASATGLISRSGLDVLPPAELGELDAKPGSTAIELTWHDPDDPDLAAVHLQWAKRGEPFEGEPAVVGKGEGRYTITGLAPSTAYEIRHWTIDVSGNASTVGSLFVTTTAAAPGGPSGPIGGPVGQPSADSDTESAELGEEAVDISLFDGKLRIAVPAGGAGSAKKLIATKLGDPAKPSDKRLRLMSDVFEWKLDSGEALAKPGRLAVAYDEAALGTSDSRKLGIYRLEAGGVWRYVGGIVDREQGVVEMPTIQPGFYAVLIAEHSFPDLTGHWGRADIEVLAARGIVTGDPGGTFRPNGNVTRAEFVKLLAALISEVPTAAGGSFTDVPADAWYAEAVAKAHAAGVVVGSGGKFRPNDPISREEMAVMLYRASGSGESPAASLAGFRDGGKVSPWAREAIAYEVQSGTLRGSDGLLRPDATATRAEAAAVLIRKLDALGLLVMRSTE